MSGDLGGQQPAVLDPALVRLAFDVHHDPAGLGITIGGTVGLHATGIGTEIGRMARIGKPEGHRKQGGEQKTGQVTHGCSSTGDDNHPLMNSTSG